METLKIWLERKSNINIQIVLKEIIFSSPAQALLSYIITIAKYYIYESKFYLKNLSINCFENFLKQKFLSEMYKAKLNKLMIFFWGNG